MQTITEKILRLFAGFSTDTVNAIDKLPQSGSERHYYRLHTGSGSYIATYGDNAKENDTFIYFSRHFAGKGLNVPVIHAADTEAGIYIQEDFGDFSLLSRLESEGFTPAVYGLFKQSLQQLARLQITGDEGLDYSKCLTSTEFGKQAIMADLLYFKYYFLDALRRPYDKQKLIDDFEALSTYLAHTEYKYFMFRDFQSRNIMVRPEGSIHFIDYQGGMKGAPQYDAASLLWQAKANLPDTWKQQLLEDYMDAFEQIIGQPVDRAVFRSQYNGYVLIRLLQVLGAYGFRGLFERKAHFLTSIPLALSNLQWFSNNQSIGIVLPAFKKVIDLCVSEEVIQSFTPIRATPDTPLVVKVSSFSYKKNGYPADETDNGGGFVFDCRGILNPGRFDEYKQLTGRDKPVKDFLEQRTRMPEFLNNIYNTVDITVEDYIKRGFKSLMINFGCTGGQHRSVYAADAVVRHLRNKYNVKMTLEHIAQDIYETKYLNTTG